MASRPADTTFLEGLLSDRALEGMRALHARRDPPDPPGRQEIVKRLRAAGLPISRAVLELEEAIGGLVYRVPGPVPRGGGPVSFKQVQLGILAALDARSEGVLRTISGAPVAPISLLTRDKGLHDLYVGDSGIVYLADEIAGSAPIAEGYQVFLEREALQGLPPPEGTGATWLFTPEHAGALLANAIHADQLYEASDSYQQVYWGPEARVLERAPHPYEAEGTYAATPRRDTLFQMLQSLHDAHPQAPVRLSPRPPAKDASSGKEPLLRLPRLADQGTDIVGELLVTGSPGHITFTAR